MNDIRLGQTVALAGEVHEMSILGLDGHLLPPGQLMVTFLVHTDEEPDVEGSER